MIKKINKIKLDLVDKFDVPIRIIDEDNTIIYMNNCMIEIFGNLLGEPANIICVNGFGKDNTTRLENRGANKRMQVYIGEALYSILSFEILVEDNKSYLVEIFYDITEQKKNEAQLKNNYNKLIKETKFAKGIQQSVLPIGDNASEIAALDSVYLPVDELSGDMYDLIKLNDNEILMYMADVSGHGIRAALLTVFLRQEIRRLSAEATENDLDRLLDKLQKSFIALDIDMEIYFGIIVCKYNKLTNELRLANAGHNCFPLILRGNGRIEEIPLKGMPITKIDLASSYEVETVGLYPGDRVVLYTDGIIEEYSEDLGIEFGVQGIRNVIDSHYGLPGDQLCQKIIHKAGRHSKIRAKDDRSIMIVTIL